MIYDYIIAGSGIAGNVCSYQLARIGKKCIVLEKNDKREEKVCGGGIPYKAIEKLSNIGIDITDFLCEDISIVQGDMSFYPKKRIENYYDSKYAIGSRRALFDEYLLGKAINEGVEIKYGESISKIVKVGKVYEVNGYQARNIVLAIGARGLGQSFTKGQSIGISAQILGESTLKADVFYFWYYENTEDKYFWVFPIGNKLWNVGIWFRYPNRNAKYEFDACWSNILDEYFKHDYVFVIRPKGEFLGNVDLRYSGIEFVNGIGDFAGTNNIKNGGGIYKAIKSALNFVEEVRNKENM